MLMVYIDSLQKNLYLHEALHSDLLACPECDKYFKRLASFKAHLSVHEEDETVACDICYEEFISVVSLEFPSQVLHMFSLDFFCMIATLSSSASLHLFTSFSSLYITCLIKSVFLYLKFYKFKVILISLIRVLIQ